MVHIKGSPKGIVIAIDNTDYDNGRQELIEKLLSAQTFFSGSVLKVHMTSNTLTEAELFFLQDIVKDILHETQVHFMNSEPKMLPQKHSPLDDLAKNESITKYIRHSIPGGKKITYEHSLVILGDIEVGAKVAADGNIIVAGNIYGVAHAGKCGNRDAYIVANRLKSGKLMIDTLSVDEKNIFKTWFCSRKAEIAFVKNDSFYMKPLV